MNPLILLKALFQMMGVFAKFERSIIAERVRSGIKRVRSEGKRWGRPPIAPALEKRIREALNKPGRTEGVRKIAAVWGRSLNSSADQPPFRGRKRGRKRTHVVHR
jgi:DNA invertase Pin-like site-specific DNA recombinase